MLTIPATQHIFVFLLGEVEACPQNLRRFTMDYPQNRSQNAMRKWVKRPHPIHEFFYLNLFELFWMWIRYLGRVAAARPGGDEEVAEDEQGRRAVMNGQEPVVS